jgi:transketolase
MPMSTAPDEKLARSAVNTIKFLAVDAVEKANSGHPGMPMGAADVAFVLWSRFLRYDPKHPQWQDRDRFVLSAGHGCMLLYGLLHLAGFDLSLSDLESFRQWDSKTPGHPEFGHTVGVEATTGPLGQGISNAVGMALSAKMLEARFNDVDRFNPVGHRIFVLVSDGDLMEGVSGEASSLAGHLGLGNLIVLYDDNRITIEGQTDLAFSEDVAARYESYGWSARRVDGHDHEAIAAAIEAATSENDKPSIILCRTHIAHGAPTKQDSAASHGSPLGAEEIEAAKKAHDWPTAPMFFIPEEVKAFFKARGEEGAALRTAWEEKFDDWRESHPEQGASWDAIWTRRVPEDIVDRLLADAPEEASATRAHGGVVLQQAADLVPGLVGGSADLTPSTKTLIEDSPAIAPGDFSGRNIHFGIREHAMGAIQNGMLYHGAFRPYGSTFLVFADYMRPPIRLAALSGLPAIYIFTHDSIFVGEDGPTHEPVEHAFSLRLIPGLHVYRPADGKETALAWGMALARTAAPTALLLSRQTLPPVDRKVSGDLADMKRGAYLVTGGERPDAIVAATGSELELALAAREVLAGEGKKINVVSIPCLDLFEEQDSVYRQRLFPQGIPVATVEAGLTGPWRGIAGPDGLTIGIDTFGASAPANVNAEKFGFTPEAVTTKIRDWLG